MSAWLRLDALAPRSAKVNRLKSDASRWLWIVTLCEAKMQKPSGRFANRQHWAACVNAPAKSLKELMDADLVHEAPALCKDCEHAVGELPNGTILVHGWHEFQIDPSTERVRRYRERVAAERDSAVTETVSVTLPSRGTRQRHGHGQGQGQDKRASLVYNPMVRGTGVQRVGDLLQKVRALSDGDE